MVDGHGLSPEASQDRSTDGPLLTTVTRPQPRFRPRVWPLLVALAILAGSLVVDATTLLVVRELARAEVIEPAPAP